MENYQVLYEESQRKVKSLNNVIEGLIEKVRGYEAMCFEDKPVNQMASTLSKDPSFTAPQFDTLNQMNKNSNQDNIQSYSTITNSNTKEEFSNLNNYTIDNKLENAIKKHEQSIKKVTNIYTEYKGLTETNKEMANIIKNLNIQIKEMENHYKISSSELYEKNIMITNEKEEICNDMKNLSSKIEDVERENERHLDDIGNLQLVNDGLMMERETFINNEKKLKRKIEDLKKENIEISEKLIQYEIEHMEISKAYDSLNQSIMETRSQNDELKRENEELREKFNEHIDYKHVIQENEKLNINLLNKLNELEMLKIEHGLMLTQVEVVKNEKMALINKFEAQKDTILEQDIKMCDLVNHIKILEEQKANLEFILNDETFITFDSHE